MVAALEEGKRSGGSGLKTWEQSITWSASSEEISSAGRINLTPQISTLSEYLSLSILDPASLHDDIHPAPVASTPASVPAPSRGVGKGAKSRTIPAAVVNAPATPSAEEEEMVEERLGRYRVGGLIGLTWFLQQLKLVTPSTLPSEVLTLLQNPILWTTLSSLTLDNSPSPNLGASQPPVRRAAYSLLSVLIETYPEEVGKEDMLELLSAAVLGKCWLEKEATVWETAGPAIVNFLSSE